MQGGNSEWLAWWNAIQSLQAEANQLNQRIAAVDAKVYGDHTNLSNSPSSLHQPLLHTFDSAKATQALRDGVAVTAAFGKAAYKAAGTKADDFQKAAQTACGGPEVVPCPEAEKWSEGGRYRTALHMAVGGMSFGTAGATGNLAAGLMGDAINTAIAQLGITDPDTVNALRMMAATIAGTAVGGTAGAAAAFNADANNRQLHPTEIEIIRREAARFARQLNGGAPPSQTEIDAAEARLAQEAYRTVQFGASGAPDSAASQFLSQFRIMLPGDPRFPGQSVGYTFYATPDQKANPHMYANLLVSDPSAMHFYAKNTLIQPSPAQIQAAIGRYTEGAERVGLLTRLAGLAAGVAAGGAPAASLAGPALTWCLANVVSCGTLVLDMAAGQAVGPSGVAGLLGIGGIKAIKTAAQANSDWIALRPGNTAAWTDGTKVIEAQLPVGQRLVMYIDERQRTLINEQRLGDALGGWATFDRRALNEAQVRQAFALTQDFKTGPLYRIELELVQPTLGRVGFTGPQPQGLLPGGGHQFQFVDYMNRAEAVRLVAPPVPVPPGG
jgi:hypothetical protein